MLNSQKKNAAMGTKKRLGNRKPCPCVENHGTFQAETRVGSPLTSVGKTSYVLGGFKDEWKREITNDNTQLEIKNYDFCYTVHST